MATKKATKNDGAAAQYARPHTAEGDDLNPKGDTYGGGAFKYDEVKKTGVETRGNGAATKGRKAYGPMA